MEYIAFIMEWFSPLLPNALLSRTEGTEVLCRLGDSFGKELDRDASSGST